MSNYCFLNDGYSNLDSFLHTFKANVSQEILNWHSLRHSHSAEICIHFFLPKLTEASKAKKSDSKISTMTMPKTMPVQNILRYIGF